MVGKGTKLVGISTMGFSSIDRNGMRRRRRDGGGDSMLGIDTEIHHEERSEGGIVI